MAVKFVYNILIIFGTLFLILMLPGCASPNKPVNNVSPGTIIEKVSDTNKNVSSAVQQSANNIDKYVQNAVDLSPLNVKPILMPDFTNIFGETTNLRQLKGQLDETIGQLAVAQQQAKTQSETINNQIAQKAKDDATISKLKSDNNNLVRKCFIGLIVLSVVGLGVAGALLYTGNMIGITVGVSSVITLVISIFAATYTTYLAIGGGVLVLIGCIVVAYTLWQRYKSNKALTATSTSLTNTGKELVQTVEATKMAMTPEARHYIFGNGPITGHVDMIQSPETKAFVRKVRRDDTDIKLAPSVPPVSIGIEKNGFVNLTTD